MSSLILFLSMEDPDGLRGLRNPRSQLRACRKAPRTMERKSFVTQMRARSLHGKTSGGARWGCRRAARTPSAMAVPFALALVPPAPNTYRCPKSRDAHTQGRVKNQDHLGGAAVAPRPAAYKQACITWYTPTTAHNHQNSMTAKSGEKRNMARCTLVGWGNRATLHFIIQRLCSPLGSCPPDLPRIQTPH